MDNPPMTREERVARLEQGIREAAAEGHPLADLPDILGARGFPSIERNTSPAFREAMTHLLYRGDVILTSDRRVVLPTAENSPP